VYRAPQRLLRKPRRVIRSWVGFFPDQTEEGFWSSCFVCTLAISSLAGMCECNMHAALGRRSEPVSTSRALNCWYAISWLCLPVLSEIRIRPRSLRWQNLVFVVTLLIACRQSAQTRFVGDGSALDDDGSALIGDGPASGRGMLASGCRGLALGDVGFTLGGDGFPWGDVGFVFVFVGSDSFFCTRIRLVSLGSESSQRQILVLAQNCL
jgi:hypothetical protein